MSLRSIATGISEQGSTYIPFPSSPEKVTVNGVEVYKYIEPEDIDKAIVRLADQIDFSQFDGVIVNLNGGRFLFERLAIEKGYDNGFTEVEYHRPQSGEGVDIVIAVPEALRNKKCLVIDDISDRGDTFMAIVNDLSPDSVCVALVSKNDIKDKKDVPNLIVGIFIDGHVWIAGCGMNIGDGSEKDVFRQLPQIVVKIPKEIISEGTWLY